MTEITYNTEQMKANILTILNEKKVGRKTTLVRQLVKDKAAIPANDREGSALLDEIFRDLEEEKFIRQQGSLTELTTKGTEAANHKNGYIGYRQEKLKEEKRDKQNKKWKNTFDYIKDAITILIAIISFINTNDNGLQPSQKQFCIGIVIGMSIIITLQYLTKITIFFKFLKRRV